MSAPSPEGTTPPTRAGARSWREWYVLALSAGAAIFCLGPSLVGARTLVSVNFLTDFLPWAASGNRSPGHQYCQSDTVDSVIPSIAYIRHQVLTGHLASWQSLTAGGGPLSALPDNGLLDPLSLPFWVLPVRWAPAFVALLCWIVAMGGVFLFLRRFSVGRPAATLAGFVFATSGFMVMWTNWPQTRTAALIPALLWATDRVATRAKLSDAVILAGVLASMLFGGFPAVTGYALYLAGGYFVVRVALLHRRDNPGSLRRIGLGITGLAVGVGLSAVQMLPFLDFYRVLNTAYRTGEAGAGLPLGGLVTTFAPNSNGLCVVGSSGVATAHGPYNPVELVAYVGAAALVLAVLGAAFALAGRDPTRRGVRGYFAVAVAVIVALGWASPSLRSTVSGLPVVSGNFIGRIRSILGFALAVLAAFGFEWLTARRGGPRHEPLHGPRRQHSKERNAGGRTGTLRRPGVGGLAWAAVTIGAATVTLALAVRAGHRDAAAGHYLPDWEHAVWIPTVLLGGSAVLAGAAALAKSGARLAFVVLPVVVVAQGAAFFHTVMPGDDPALFYPRTADTAFLAAHLGGDRFADAGLPLYTGEAYYLGLRSATGHSFTETRWNDLLTAVDPTVMHTPTNSDFGRTLAEGHVGRQPILDRMGVRYVVTDPGDLPGARPDPPAATGAVPLSGAGEAATCTLPGGPIRGVTVRLAAALAPSDPPTAPTVHVKVSDGTAQIESAINLYAGVPPPGSDLSVPVVGEDLAPGRPLRVSVWATGSSTPLVLAGTGGQAACAAVTPLDDGLRLVFADAGAIVLQRLDAMPRIRWASSAVTVAGPSGQLAAMRAGAPASQVLLSAPGPAASGAATVHVSEDSGDLIAARVDASGPGYLVVADPMQMPGWAVTVDGHSAALRQADYAMVAVAVPAGAHTIRFAYTPPGEKTGAAITIVALLAAAILVWSDARPAFGRRRHDRSDTEQPADT